MATERIEIVVSERGAKTVSRNVEDIGRAARSAQGSLQLLQRALGFLLTGAVVRQVVALSDSFQDLNNRVKLFANSQEEANKSVKGLVDLAINTRTRLGDVATIYQRLALQSGRLGLSQQKTLRITELLSKTIAISGSSAAEAGGALVQFAQALGGEFQSAGQEINSVLEQLPALAEALARGLSQPGGKQLVAQDIKKLAREGALTSDLVLKALESQGDRIDAQFSRIAPTISSAFTNITTALTVLVGKLFETSEAGKGIANFLLGMAKSMIEVANDATKLNAIINTLIVGFQILVGLKVASFVLSYARAMDAATVSTARFIATSASAAFTGIVGFFKGAATGAITFRTVLASLLTGIRAVGAALVRLAFSNIFTAAATAILLAVAALFKYRNATVQIDDTTVTMRDVVVGAWNLITEKIGGAVTKMKEFLGLGENGIFKRLGDFFREGIGSALSGTALGDAAKKAAEARKAAEAKSSELKPDLNIPLPELPGVGTDLTNEIASLDSRLKDLRDTLDPVNSALQEYKQQQLEIKDLLDKGKVSQEEANRLYGLSDEKLQNLLLTTDEFLDTLSGGPAVVAAFKTAFDDFAAGVQTPFDVLHSSFDAVFGGLEQTIDTFVETGKVSFKDFASSVLQDLQKILIKSLLVQAITSGVKGLQSQGGFLGSLGSSISGAVGQRQAGGMVTQGQPFKVGESGTELFVPPSRGRIMSNSQMSGFGGGNQVVQNFTINTPDADSFRRSESQILRGANRNLRRAETRR